MTESIVTSAINSSNQLIEDVSGLIFNTLFTVRVNVSYKKINKKIMPEQLSLIFQDLIIASLIIVIF